MAPRDLGVRRGTVMHVSWLCGRGLHTNPFSRGRKNRQPAVFRDLLTGAEDIIIYCALHSPRALQNRLKFWPW